MKIIVVGSSNIDMIAQVDHLPAPGETVGQAKFMQAYGGKGANQAVAAARLGGNVTFITALGNDMYAKALKEHFLNEGIITDNILVDSKNPTGTALIFVASNAENCIAVAPGANGSLLPNTLTTLDNVLEDADIVVMQAEIPYQTIKQVAMVAHKHNVKVLFNPAPACHIDSELMNVIDFLVVNESEAEFITGAAFTENNVEELANILLAKGAKNVIITLGHKGLYMKNGKENYTIPGFKVDAVDTTAAGDVFCGALAVVCAKENIDERGLLFANAAAALAVTRVGAQPSIPQVKEVKEFLQSQK